MNLQGASLLLVATILTQWHPIVGLLRCNLNLDPQNTEWNYLTIGEEIPNEVIKLGGIRTNSYIAVADTGDGYFIGTYHENLNIGYFPSPVFPTELDSFAILKNMENCTTKWENAGSKPPAFAVPSINQQYYIGRILTVDGYYYAGNINYNNSPPIFTVAIESETKNLTVDGTIQVLTSFSAGIKMSVENVEILLEPDTDDVNAMAVEEIRNNGNTIVSQTIEHKKTIYEVYSNTISSTYSTRDVHSCGWSFNIWIAAASHTYREEHTYTETKTETWTTEKTTEINLQRKITVPAYEGVQVCSVVTIKDKIDIEYEGDMVYTAPGVSAEEIAEILWNSNNPIKVTILNGKATLPNVKGKFKGSVAMQSAFFIVDLKSNIGCLEYAQNVARKSSGMWHSLKKEMQNNAYNSTV